MVSRAGVHPGTNVAVWVEHLGVVMKRLYSAVSQHDGRMSGWKDGVTLGSSCSDKQELLPEAEDHLSVDSLSLPESPKANQA